MRKHAARQNTASMPVPIGARYRGSAERTFSYKLITAWQAENKALLYLSAGDYNCGDPKSPLYKKYATSKDPGTLVSKEHVNKYWTASLNYIAAYVKLLKAIAGEAEADQKMIKEAVAIGSTAAAYIPGITASTAVSALSALGTVASDFRGLAGVFEISAAARDAQEPLAPSVRHVKRYYPTFAKNEQTAFDAWDECANEKLIFMRDQPLGKIPSYRKAYFTTSTGIDLDAAYNAYLTQRQSFVLDGSVNSIDKILDQILVENSKLADPQITWESFQAAVKSLNTFIPMQ